MKGPKKRATVVAAMILAISACSSNGTEISIPHQFSTKSLPTPTASAEASVVPPTGTPTGQATGSIRFQGPAGRHKKQPIDFDRTPEVSPENVIPGEITVVFKNPSKVRKLDKLKLSILGDNRNEESALDDFLKKHKAKKLKHLYGRERSDSEFDAEQREVSAYYNTDVPHWKSMYRIEIPETEDPINLCAELRKLNCVRTAYPMQKVAPASTLISRVNRSGQFLSPPSDPDFGNFPELQTSTIQATPENPSSPNTPNTVNTPNWWWFNRHRIFHAWDVYGTATMPTIAVIDSGFDTSQSAHDRPNYLTGAHFAGGAYVDTNVSEPSTATYSHGTSVVSMIASPKNSEGLAGVAPGANIYPMRIEGTGDFAPAIDHVSGKPGSPTFYSVPNTINISWTVASPTPGLQVPMIYVYDIRVAVAYATGSAKKNVVLAAGNTGANIDYYIVGLRGDEIIVGGTRPDAKEWTGSNYGTTVDLAAAGELVSFQKYSPSSGVRRIETGVGTSFSAPIVAGVAAMMKQVGGPNYSNPDRVKDTLIGTATLGTTANQNRYLGAWLSDGYRNVGNKAHIRDLNACDAILMAKYCGWNHWPVARISNVDDYVMLAKNYNWSSPVTTESYLSDSIWDLTNDGYQSGDEITWANYNSPGGGQRSSAVQIFWQGYLDGEMIYGVATHEAPWATNPPLYSTVGADGDTTSDWFDLTSYFI